LTNGSCVACGPGGISTGLDAATCTCGGTGYLTTLAWSATSGCGERPGQTRPAPCGAACATLSLHVCFEDGSHPTSLPSPASGCANGYYKTSTGTCVACLDGAPSTTGYTSTCTCGTGGTTYSSGSYTAQGCRESPAALGVSPIQRALPKTSPPVADENLNCRPCAACKANYCKNNANVCTACGSNKVSNGGYCSTCTGGGRRLLEMDAPF
jgi:hypothetical protein